MKTRFVKIVYAFLIIAFVVNTTSFGLNIPIIKAASNNLIQGGSFEGNIHTDWGFWQNSNSSRSYDFYRAYDAAFGYGSYAGAIDANGNSEDAFAAILSTKQNFTVESGKNYYLLFYAKATQPSDIITYLQRADNYNAITSYQARTISDHWQRYMVSFSPSASTNSFLAIVLGGMPDNASLYIDGVELVEADNTLETKIISGYIGETNKFLRIKNIANFSQEEISIELPFYDNSTLVAGTTRIKPTHMTNSGIYFTMPEASFAGVGRVYVNDIFIGQFNYAVKVKIKDFHPNLIRLNEDLIVSGTGFSPLNNSTFLIAEKINNENKKEKVWLSPLSFDSSLTQMRFRLPAGVVAGSLYMQVSFTDMDGQEMISKSNNLPYKLKPIVFATNWSARGYEQVGDKLKIYGLGFGRHPMVKYYNDNNELIDSIRAEFIEVGDSELIEVPTTKKNNHFNIVVEANGVESDQSSALAYLAKPVLSSIKAKHTRTVLASNEKIPASKVGEELILSGLSLQSATSGVTVEFQGDNQRISVPVVTEANSRQAIKVIVPNGALNGYVGVRVNGIDSNYLPLEIIPTVTTTSPNPIVPGETMIINAYGVGNNLNLLKVNFSVANDINLSLSADSIIRQGETAIISLRAPYGVSFKDTKIGLQYDRWQDSGKTVLNIRPHIVRAGINMDNKVLSIIGYGFSITPRENIITYKYANEDQTVINPQVRLLGVYPTEEGQEIRIKIMDDYYFGLVSVQVGEYSSNEVNFGPISVKSIARRVEYVESSNAQMGVLYVKGYNFGSGGGVLVGDIWAEVHYRSDFFIIAVVPVENLYDGPVIVARE